MTAKETRLLLPALLCLCTLGCQRPDRAQQTALSVARPPAEDVFRYAAIGGEFLDPARVADTAAHQLALNLFEGLYAYPPGNGAPTPALGSGCDTSDDGLIVTCHLRPGLTWSDGTPLTAADFLWSWRRVLEPKTASRSAHLLWFIKGAKAFNDGSKSDVASVGIRQLDALTLQIELAAPTPFFKNLLAEMPYAPAPRHVVERYGARWTRPAHIVTSGPYLLARHRQRSLIELRKNPRYWDAAHVRIERARLYLTESEQTAHDWYHAGKVDWTGDLALPTDKLARLSKSKRPDFHTDPYLCTYYYAFATTRPPFDDPRVRRAFSLAIDRDELLLQVLNNGATAASGNVPDLFGDSHGYHARSELEHDPTLARRLLAEAGYPGGVGLPPIELTFNTQDIHRIVAEFVQDSLRRHLGAHIRLANMEWKTLLKRMRTGDFSLSRSGWCADYPDPLTFLEVLHSDNAANYPGFADPAYDALIERARRADGQARRARLFAQAEAILARQRPILPIFHYARAYLLRPWVRGFGPHMQDFHPLKHMWIDRRGAKGS